MLLAVEGGGFFSSSASGYSKGLTLLLLGKKTEEKPMRVTPWNQYQLVDPDLQLASHNNNNHLVRGCASFLCFGRTTTTAGLDPTTTTTSSPLKVGPTHQNPNQNVVKSSSPDLQKVEEKDGNLDLVVDDDDNGVNGSSLRSSLKRPTTTSVLEGRNDDNGLDHNTEKRVQWTDVSGGDLFVIREFEPSEHSGSDDEYENGNERSCSCRLM